MPIGGSATLLEARAIRDKVRCLVASMRKAHEEDIVVDSGWLGVRGSPDRAMALAQRARTVHVRSNERHGIEPSLEATRHHTDPTASAFTKGAHLAVVQLDAATGRVRVEKYVAVGNGGQLVTGTLMDYAVPPAAKRVRRALGPSRYRQAGDPA